MGITKLSDGITVDELRRPRLKLPDAEAAEPVPASI